MSDPSLHIRDAEAGDVDRIYEIEGSSFPDPYPIGLLKAFLFLPGAYVVAVMDGRIVGYAIGMIRSKSVGHIVSVAVDRAMRGKGIGKAIMRVLIGKLESQGAKKIRLEVRISNTPAISMYRKLGFSEKGELKNYYADGESAQLMYFISRPNPQK